MSSFVCRVFENYYEKAEASISKTLSRLEERLNKALENISPDNLDHLRLFQQLRQLGRGYL